MTRRLNTSIALIVAIGALAACGTSENDDSASSSTTASTSAQASSGSESTSATPESSGPAESGAPAESSAADASISPAPPEAEFPGDTNPDTGTASADAQLVLVDVRSATHDGYDRVVLEFSGPGTPGWTAQYADAASRQGSGEAITVDGSTLIDITVTGSAIPAEGQPTVNAGPITPSGTTAVKGIFNDGTFEGITHVVLGVDAQQPFRVYSEANPARVVIDVKN